MEYFNTGGGGSGNGTTDPYAVIPQQFGTGAQQPPQQTVYFQYPEYPQEGVVDYDSYQQQQYRAAQASQQSPSIYYHNQLNQGSYFPIHSASDHDFLGPQQPSAGATSSSGQQTSAPYQSRTGANKEFMIQHQQRRGNQSGPQQGQQAQQSAQPQQQNQPVRQQNQQQMQQQQQTNQQSHFMHQQMQAVAQQQQAQQMHQRIHGAAITPQQFMQQQAHQIHQMQLHQQQQQQQQQQQHPRMMPQQQSQQGFHAIQSNHQQNAGHHHQQHHQNQHQHQHNQNHPGQQNIPQNRFMLRDWPIRCVVEGKYQQVIMGEHGATIRDIAQSCHCRVDFIHLSKKERMVLGNSDRILTIHGYAEQASKAVARILDVIQTEAIKDDAMVGADVVLRLRAHNQLCGRLIGKGGTSIKDIMQKTGTNITVSKHVDPPGGYQSLRQDEMLGLSERTIVIRGPSIEAVVQAESLISAKLKKCYESDSHMRNQGMPMAPMMMPPIPPQVAGMIPGAPQLFPTPAGVVQIQHFPRPPHQQLTQNNAFLASGVLQIAPGVTNLRHVRMWVPDNMIGALIGAKGKNIKMIIRDTGAAVKIEAPEEKVQREAVEAEKKKKKSEDADTEERDGAASGDHPQEFLDDNGTVTSSDAIEEKPKPINERMVTITGDDYQLLKAQSFVFTKISETTASQPVNTVDGGPYNVKLRTEVCVPTKIIGRIIGKGGQNVRELQRITGACVKIPEEERNGGSSFTNDDGFVEEMTLIRITGTMSSTHNVQFRLAHLISEYYRAGETRPKSSEHKGARPQSGSGKEGAGLDNMDQLGQVPPIATNRSSPKSRSTSKSKSP
ncbi:hypothetical protein L5515_004123 [Caenorhabditis briggsae]|uniref:K Homology domain-containing protein n=1 Tax=Caenorhabditis briggsae TaxID=6238 RepID=A0AAE9JAL9_CAEBR|nr:hypothetical protein L5515_004123 [Caenorhabditis briggsae]